MLPHLSILSASGPELTSYAMLLPFIHAAHALENRIERALETVGLSMAKHGVLTQLLAAEAMPLSELAARLSCVRSNMTQLIDRMEIDGLVQRVPDPSDRRIVRAEITAHGRERAAAGDALLRSLETAFAALLSEREHNVLRHLIARIE